MISECCASPPYGQVSDWGDTWMGICHCCMEHACFIDEDAGVEHE